MWKCKKCGGVIRLFRKNITNEVYEIKKDGKICDKPLSGEVVETEENEYYICLHCGKVFKSSEYTLKDIGEWVEK